MALSGGRDKVTKHRKLTTKGGSADPWPKYFSVIHSF